MPFERKATIKIADGDQSNLPINIGSRYVRFDTVPLPFLVRVGSPSAPEMLIEKPTTWDFGDRVETLFISFKRRIATASSSAGLFGKIEIRYSDTPLCTLEESDGQAVRYRWFGLQIATTGFPTQNCGLLGWGGLAAPYIGGQSVDMDGDDYAIILLSLSFEFVTAGAGSNVYRYRLEGPDMSCSVGFAGTLTIVDLKTLTLDNTVSSVPMFGDNTTPHKLSELHKLLIPKGHMLTCSVSVGIFGTFRWYMHWLEVPSHSVHKFI